MVMLFAQAYCSSAMGTGCVCEEMTRIPIVGRECSALQVVQRTKTVSSVCLTQAFTVLS